HESARARTERVKRAYLATRAHELGDAAGASERLEEPARTWIEEACAIVAKIRGTRGAREIEPLGALGRARGVVALAGRHAASGPADTRASDGELARRLIALAQRLPPGAWTRDDVEGRPSHAAAAPELPSGTDRWAWLVRELGRAAPDPRVVARAEDEA